MNVVNYGAHTAGKEMPMRQRALLILLFSLLLIIVTGCDSTGLPGLATPKPTAAPAQPTATTQSIIEPTSTSEALANPTPTEPVVADAPTDTPEISAASTDTPAVAQTTPLPQGSPESQANQQLIKTIEQEASNLRGLKPLKDVPDQFISADQLRANLTKDMQDNYSEKQSKQDVSALWLMRLINDPTLDLYQFEIDLQTEQVLGYYDQHKGDLFVLNIGQQLSPLAEQTLAHEYTHALQDQRYNLSKLLPDKSTDDDRDLGVRSVVEGDAFISGFVWAQTYLSPQDYQKMLDAIQNAPSSILDSAPKYIRDSLDFPYDQGVQFVIALGILKGYGPIDKALQDPPVSSEQIMHPEKYTSTPRDLPKPVALTPLTDTLGTGWTMPENGTLGEFDLQEMLEQTSLGKTQADNAAAGWGGGVYNYYENGDKHLVVFNTVWDTRKDADEFETALNDSFASDTKNGTTWTDPDGKRFFSVKRTGNAIAVGASTDLPSLEKAMLALK
jgi:hypothetical protein